MRRHAIDREQQIIKKCLQNLRALDGCQADYWAEKVSAGHSGQLQLQGAWGKANYASEGTQACTPLL